MNNLNFGNIVGISYLGTILKCWRYKSGPNVDLLKSNLAQNYGRKSDEIFLYNNARSAEYEFLKSLNLPTGSNIIVQAFTCNAVVNPILWLGLEPRYVDIDAKNLSLFIADLKSKIDSRTKVIILQHTFGLTGPIREVLSIAEEKGILVLEDCAHSLGVTYDGKTLGTFGDAAIVSFGLEKVLSTRVGGALIVNNEKLLSGIRIEYSQLKHKSPWNIFIWLLNPVIWRILRNFGQNQWKFASFLNKIGLLNMGFYRDELIGKMPARYPRLLGNALSGVVLDEMRDLDDLIQHRIELSKCYFENLKDVPNIELVGTENAIAFLRYPAILGSEELRDRLFEYLSDKGIYVGDWYNPVVYPKQTDLSAMKYKNGMCPIAEDIARRIINLPTGKNVTMDMAKSYCEEIRNFIKNSR